MKSPFKRTLFSFFANVIRSILSILTGMLIARGLGSADYGVFSFLIASFTALKSLLDMGSSSAFFSFISKKYQSKSYVVSYLIWLFIQFLLSILLIGILCPESWIERIWQGELRGRVLLAFITVFFQEQIWGALNAISESQRLTVNIQSLNMIIAAMHFLLVIILCMLHI